METPRYADCGRHLCVGDPLKKLFVLLAFVLVGCSNTNPLVKVLSSSSTAPKYVTGVVSAGPLISATVRAYVINNDGTVGLQLGSTTTDAYGNYSLNLSSRSLPVMLVASAGSYKEEASGVTVSMGLARLRTLLPSIAAGQKVGVSALTEIAAQVSFASISSNTSLTLASIIKSTNARVGNAVGILDITVPPANIYLSSTYSNSTTASQHALILAGISEMSLMTGTANVNTLNSLDVMQALATAFIYNGNFNPMVGTADVLLTNSANATLTLSSVYLASGNSAFNNAISLAVTAYEGTSTAITNRFTNIYVPAITFPASPITPVGNSAVTLPSAPTTLPTTRPTVSGVPYASTP